MRPNILFLMSDEHRADVSGFGGNEVIRTPILKQLTPEQVDYMTARIPKGRPGTLEEVAAVAHFLASPDCSFVTGQCYDVSGGRATY